MGRERRHHADLYARLRYRAEHPVRTLGLVAWLSCICMLIGASAPAHSGAKGKAHKAAPVPAQVRGVNLSPNRAFWPAPYGDPGDDDREIASACQLGAGIVREFVSWGLLEKEGPGKVNEQFAARLDSLMAQADRCHIKVLFTLLGTPTWDLRGRDAADPRSTTYPGDSGPDQFRWMVSWILHRWPQLYALEVWNEPNLNSYWKGTPSQYADLVNAAVAAKQDVGASTLILGGTLALGAADYLRELYAAGMRGQDGISLHPYSMTCAERCGQAQFLDPGSPRAPYRTAIENVHRAMVQNGDRGGLWLTELGFSTCPAQPACVPDGQQASWMSRSIRVAACYPYVAGLTAFTLRDIPVPPNYPAASYWDYHFGLMSSDFSPKPAFNAVSSTFRQLGSGPPSRRARSSRARAAMTRAKCRRILGSRNARKGRRHRR